MPRHDPVNFFFVIVIALIAVISGLLYWLQVSPVVSCLIGTNAITFIFYGFDKRQSRKNKLRVPEIILHILAFLGGSPGAFLGQIFFRHKTKKLRFRIVFLAIVSLQILFGFYYWQYWR